ncbi:hypothetical protein HPB52_011356 [Rhipicephalus sanguineus]|uniref:Uncharacterized protein n=1 Tax=Rhipicephalus sanguineus TaxID=34632 RepID=A0A9D4SYV6_RHISA|nr:hypothetical protein HPB52_011356 [Rhipicephalus sanguineus]
MEGTNVRRLNYRLVLGQISAKTLKELDRTRFKEAERFVQVKPRFRTLVGVRIPDLVLKGDHQIMIIDVQVVGTWVTETVLLRLRAPPTGTLSAADKADSDAKLLASTGALGSELVAGGVKTEKCGASVETGTTVELPCDITDPGVTDGDDKLSGLEKSHSKELASLVSFDCTKFHEAGPRPAIVALLGFSVPKEASLIAFVLTPVPLEGEAVTPFPKEPDRDKYTGRPVWLLPGGPVIDSSVGVTEQDVTVEAITGRISDLE